MSKAAPHGHTSSQLLAGEERRRSQRVMLKIPVNLTITIAGKVVTANAATVSVNDHGAMLSCTRSFPAETMLELQNERTGERMTCRVTRSPIENQGGYLIPVEFATVNPSFWRISFPPRDWKPGDE
jgi:hypothetical protein